MAVDCRYVANRPTYVTVVSDQVV